MSAFVPDTPHPLHPADQDAFGHRDYAAALADVVQTVEAPFTIGLFGQWGAGKTSILREVERRVEASKQLTFAIFDVWKYEGDALRRQLLIDLAFGLDKRGLLKHGFSVEKLVRDVTTDVSEAQPRLALGWRHALVSVPRAAVAAALVFGVLRLTQAAHLVTGKAHTDLVVGLVAGAIAFSSDALAQAFRVTEVQVTRRRIEEPDLFAARFSSLISAVKTQRLVLAVDNLDRCAPDRVAELLATIKTFLEPADTSKDLVFVIAADYSALRRHLISREVSASLGAGSSGPSGVPQEVSEAVDEYLRKFFNAGLVVEDVLGEDARDYAQRHFGALFARHEYPAELEAEVVDLVGTSLARNPRRIIQFVNNLELRIQLIKHREASGHIAPKISGNLLMIAKLEILRERWPDRYEELSRDPVLLREWHETAVGAVPANWPLGLVAFLRSTEDILDPNVGAYVRLKQRVVERRLARYDDFASAVRGGDDALAIAILQESSDDDQIAYLDDLPDWFLGDVSAGRQRSAASILRFVLMHAGEPRFATPARRTLSIAVRRGDLRERLANLDAAHLLSACAVLNVRDAERVLDALVAHIGELDDPRDPAISSFFDAVAEGVGLTELQAQRVRDVLATERMASQFSLYAQMVSARPGLLPDAALQRAVEALPTAEPLDPAESRLIVAFAGLRESHTDPRSADVMASVMRSVVALSATAPEKAGELAAAAGIFVGTATLGATVCEASIVQLQAIWPQLPVALRVHVMVLIDELLGELDAAARSTYATWFSQYLPSDSEAAILELRESVALPNLRDAYLPLVQARAETAESLSDAEALFGVFDHEDPELRAAAVTNAVERAIESEHFERTFDLLDGPAANLGLRATSIDQLLARIEDWSVGVREPEFGMLVTRGMHDLSDAHLLRVRSLLLEEFQSDDAALVAAARATVQGLENEERLKLHARYVVEQLFDWFAAHVSEITTWPAILEFLTDQQELLTSAQSEALGRLILRRMSEFPDDRIMLAGIAGRLSLSPARREGLIGELLALELDESDSLRAGALLDAAQALSGAKGKARNAIAARRAERVSAASEGD